MRLAVLWVLGACWVLVFQSFGANASFPVADGLLDAFHHLLDGLSGDVKGSESLTSATLVPRSSGNRKLTEQAPSRHPKIYIYDVPADPFKPAGKDVESRETFYGLDFIFPELLRSSPYYTNNTEEADYFYMDMWMYWAPMQAELYIEAVRKLGPWWDRKQGADHIWVVTHDFGRCDMRVVDGRKSIFLHHFGRIAAPQAPGECKLLEQWGGSCDWTMLNAELALRGADFHPCHLPDQDIVVPPTPYEYDEMRPGTHKCKTPYLHPELRINRTDLIFYSGKIDLHGEEPDAKERPWSDAGYSWGARQTTYRPFAEHPGFKIYTRHTPDDYWKHLSHTIFCLAPPGWGWGGRMKTAVTRGCIPIIVQDGTKVEWEEQLPLKDYAIRVPIWLVHKLPDILQAFIDTGRVAKMQKVMECTWRLHWWRRPHGRAFDLVMCELKRRLLGAAKIRVDTENCILYCGDNVPVNLLGDYNAV